jgi:hypothetical protein
MARVFAIDRTVIEENAQDMGIVSATQTQTFTDEQQEQARDNIAAQLASANLDRLDVTANEQRAAIGAAAQTQKPAVEEVGVVVVEVQPTTSGEPPFRVIYDSVSNADAGPTYNRVASFGFNNSATNFHGDAILGKPTALFTAESNFKDGNGEYGPELILEFSNTQRPFYARQIFDPATTTIAAGSNGASLPQATINVASTTNFPQYGNILVGASTIAYTGKTSTTFTGCSGGSGTLSTGQAVESEFRSNSNIQLDIGSDEYGSLQVYAGKLLPSWLSFSVAAGWSIRGNVDFQNGILIIPPTALQTNGSKFAPARRYYSEDFAGDATITIPADFVDVFRARITTTGTPIIAAPTNPTEGQELTIILSNRFGGVTISGPNWNSVFKLATWGTNPSPGTNRKITFVYDGTNWTEISRSELIAN